MRSVAGALQLTLESAGHEHMGMIFEESARKNKSDQNNLADTFHFSSFLRLLFIDNFFTSYSGAHVEYTYAQHLYIRLVSHSTSLEKSSAIEQLRCFDLAMKSSLAHRYFIETFPYRVSRSTASHLISTHETTPQSPWLS